MVVPIMDMVIITVILMEDITVLAIIPTLNTVIIGDIIITIPMATDMAMVAAVGITQFTI
jgi:hypothetical protein